MGRYVRMALGAALASGLAAGPAQAFVLLGPTWSPLGTPASVTYSFFDVGSAVGDAGTIAPLWGLNGIPEATWRSEIRRALDTWSAAGAVTFTEVPDGNNAWNAPDGSSGQIRFARENIDGANSVLAHAFAPGTVNGGDAHFDDAENWTAMSLDADPSTVDIWWVAVHELGHSIGLNHTGVGGNIMQAVYNESLLALGADDIAGAVALFGAATPEPLTLALGVMSLAALGIHLRRRSPPPS